MSSSRLPGKALLRIGGRPLLSWVIESLERATSLDEIVVATSGEDEDDAIVGLAADHGVRVHRGELHDVAGRVIAAADAHNIDVVARVSGDSPLLVPAVVDAVVAAFRQHDPDLATNVHPRTFPRGQSCEAVSLTALRRAHPRMDRSQREHVTRWFYDNAEEVTIVNISHTSDLSSLRHCVDTAADAARVEAILEAVGKPPWQAGLDRLVQATPGGPVTGPAG